MKKLYQLLTACTFALVLLCAAPAGVNAAEAAPAAKGSGVVTHMNPEYRNMSFPMDLAQPALASDTVIDETEPALGTLTYKEAIAYLTKQMVARKTSITFTFVHNQQMTQAVFEKMFTDAFEETSKTSSEAGDYLRYHYYGANAKYNYGYSGGNYIYEMQLTVQYMSTAKQEEAVTKKLNSVIKQLKLKDKSKSDYEKIQAVYKYITDNICYDYDSFYYYANTGKITGHESAWAAYGGLIKNTCVCQGYSSLFHRFMDEIGISSRVITGDAGGRHAWNIVKIGKYYYNLDTTWDAYSPDDGIMKGTRNWFLLGNANFKKHTRDAEFKTSKFNKNYPMAKKNYKPGQSTSGPKLSATQKTINVKDSFNLELKNYSGSQTIKWSTSNKSVASISKISKTKYKVTGKKAGKATITAKVGSKSYKCTVTVKAANAKLSATEKTIYVNKSFDLELKNYSGSQTIKWSTSNKSVASISKISKTKYKVTGKKAGKATITAKVGSKNYKCTVTVKKQTSNGYDKLKQYITKKGSINSSGNRFIKMESDGTTWGIVYDQSKNAFQFLTLDSRNNINTSLEMIYSNKKDKVSIQIVLYDTKNKYGFITETSFKPSSYKGKDVTFTVEETAGTKLSYKTMNEASNTFLKLGFAGWNKLIKNKVGLKMSDIGFTSYK